MRIADLRRLRTALRTATALMLTATAAAFAPQGANAPAASAPVPDSAARGTVDVIQVDDAITPITLQQIERQIDESATRGARALVLVMDTPGGLESAMRSIVQAILASPIPVITYVSPPGARAASAGLFIVTASHVAAMAPSTNLGAASPVAMGGTMDSTLAKKAMSDAAALIEGLAQARGRNVEWNGRAVREAISAGATEAVELNIVDFIADDLDDVLRKAHGRMVMVAGVETTLDLASAELREITPSFRLRVLSFIANPNVAYLLLTLGFYGLLFELQSPGAILPGVAGAIFLILGAVALQMLPVNAAGLALIVLALAFFVIELKVQSHGVLATGGVLSFAIGSLILFQPGRGDVFRVSWPVIVGTTAATAAFFIFAIGKALAAQKRRVTTGPEALIGSTGETLTPLAPRGQIRVHGEIWQAETAGHLPAGAGVEVLQMRGLTLVVAPRSKEYPE
ncbi:MAG: nodulation protein NfeD [Gemmatimonadetes bacterium]|nr:nodulation protein NfeD [Gemmatimonadota bacterium]